MNRPSCCDEHLRATFDRKDLLAMQVLAPLSSTYLPWSLSAIRPSGLVAILNEIVVNRRRTIVELGGGVSTFYIGRLLRRRPGHLWTVEHDEPWADLLEHGLAAEELSDVVTVVRAPLTPVPHGWPGEDATWYEEDRISKAIADQRIDLLIIDGPPAYRDNWRHRRYPAVPVLAPMLADDYTIVLDDIDRRGEQDIMTRWERQLGVTFERRLVDGAIGVGRSRAAFTI
jgi:hypothetical protein